MKRFIIGLFFLFVPMYAEAAGPSPYTPSETPGGIYLSSPITFQNGQTPVFMMDQNGYLKIDIAGTSVPIPVTPGVPTYTPLGYCRLTVTTDVETSTCSGGIPANTNYMTVCNEGSAARWSDTTTPTTGALGVGMPFPSGTSTAASCFPYYGSGSTLQWVSQDGTDVILSFQFYQIH